MLSVVYVVSDAHVACPQVDLIDFQSFADGSFKWLLVYVDHGLKFTMLEPLTSNVLIYTCIYGYVSI